MLLVLAALLILLWLGGYFVAGIGTVIHILLVVAIVVVVVNFMTGRRGGTG
jgi:hypothetical protein